MELDNPVIAHEPEKRPKKWDTSFIQEPSAILVASLCCPGFIIRDLAAYNKMNERLWCYLGTWCCLIPPVQSVLVQIQREKIRNRKRIENSFTKFLLSFICYPCALAQTRLELLNDEEMDKYINEINNYQSQHQIRPRLSFWRRTFKKKKEPATTAEKQDDEQNDEK